MTAASPMAPVLLFLALGGGSALWFADQCRALRLNTKVITLDIVDMRAAEAES